MHRMPFLDQTSKHVRLRFLEFSLFVLSIPMKNCASQFYLVDEQGVHGCWEDTLFCVGLYPPRI